MSGPRVVACGEVVQGRFDAISDDLGHRGLGQIEVFIPDRHGPGVGREGVDRFGGYSISFTFA